MLALLLAALPLRAEPPVAPRFGAVTGPSPGAPAPIGSYARGCAAGLVALPPQGPGWVVMRPSRNRAWGHPAMIGFLRDLAQVAQQAGWQGLHVGDIAQPRGGPMRSGHASHQTGLDADIWMRPGRDMALDRAARETLSSVSVLSADRRGLNAAWTPAHATILRAAAEDARVDRIFVTAPVKIALCETATRADRAWLRKIRPWYGHDAHFHVRLSCPADAHDCIPQHPGVAELSGGGDGCDETLSWWVTEALAPPAPPDPAAPRPRAARDLTLADLPAQCAAVLSAR